MYEFKARKQIRLKNYDYSANGYYFITVCSKNRENLFGKFVGAPLARAHVNETHACDNNVFTDNHFELSKCGQIIEHHWYDLPNQYDHVELDQFVIMPNHIHGILIINNRAQTSSAPTVSQIIRSFKSKSTMKFLKYINDNNLNISGKIWQRSFYDHIIRNERSLNAIRKYIANNPVNWDQDIDKLINP